MSPHVLELYRSPRSPSPFPHTRPDRSWLAARPGSAPLNDLGRPAMTAPGSTDVPEVSPPSLPSLSPSTRTTMPGRTSPFSGESTLRHTDRDRSATWCRVTYIVNTLYQPTTRSKIAGDASLAGEDPLDTKLGHKDGHREKYLNQSHAQNCRRRLTRRAETHSITKLGHKEGPREICLDRTHAQNCPRHLTRRANTHSINELGHKDGPWEICRNQPNAQNCRRCHTRRANTHSITKLGQNYGPGRYNSTVHTLNTAGDASLGVQRPTRSPNLAKMKGPERYNSIGQMPKTAGDASLGGQRHHSITKVGHQEGPHSRHSITKLGQKDGPREK